VDLVILSAVVAQRAPGCQKGSMSLSSIFKSGAHAQLVRSSWQSFLDALYPPQCRVCEAGLMTAEESNHELSNWLCRTCLEELERVVPPYCSSCGEAFEGAMTRAFRCWNCEGRRVVFDFAISGYKAAGPMRELIHRFKYGHDLSLRAVLAKALGAALMEPRLAKEELRQWVLVPVPLHFLRQMQRGFNQSWELCCQLSAITGIPAAQALRRRRFTRTQASLQRRQRLENLRGVFVPRTCLGRRDPAVWKGRCVLLVDDVLTTGATANECAKVLKRELGVRRVVVLTVARG
jgi:competence protein ComFC